MNLIHTFLLQAIEGETSAELRYNGFSSKAAQDGLPGIATLFLALSRAEAIHVTNHKRALQKNGYISSFPEVIHEESRGTTSENIEQAITAEYEEFQVMYPTFRRQIKKKYGGDFNAKVSLLSIKWANDSEANHHTLLKKAQERVTRGEDMTGGDFYLCTVCGNVHFYSEYPVELCKVCGHDLSFYSVIRMDP